MFEESEGWFSLQMSSYQYSKYHCEDEMFISLILTIVFPILVRQQIYIETTPRSSEKLQTAQSVFDIAVIESGNVPFLV